MVIKKKIVITVVNYSYNTIKQVRTISFMKPCIVMTGMHRSGTSFLSRACNLGGVYLGKWEQLMSHEWNSLDDNKKGHWENNDIHILSNETLQKCGGSWSKIPESVTIDEKIKLPLETAIKILEKPPSLSWGFKDPCFPILYKAWNAYLPKNIIIMSIFRHPLKVAQSLAVRNSFEYEKSIKLWNIYNEKLLEMLEKYPGFVFSFDWGKEQLINELKMVFEKIGLCSTIDFEDWYADELLHSDNTYDTSYEIPPETQRIYDKLIELSKKNNDVDLKIKCVPDKVELLTEHLYQSIQNQGIYFNKISNHNAARNQKNIVEIDDLKTKLKEVNILLHVHQSNEISLRKQLIDIHNSFTWKMLRKLDKIRH